MLIREILRRKRNGDTLERGEIETLVAAVTDGSAGDEQLGAFAMAVFLNGMNDTECAALTEAMRDSGQTMKWDDPALSGPALDKHSTGGVGDTTSLLLGPWVAACGGFVPMISGHGLGHTGGTLDKMASIPGYRVSPAPAMFRRVVRQVGVAIIGQTRDLAPADRRLYGIRDVTSTVESIPMIVASILSKKLAEGLDALVMDVKVGNGAVMPDPDAARELARRLSRVAALAGTPVTGVLSDMGQPLADSAGNALEVLEAVECLTGQRRNGRLLALSRRLAAEMLIAGGLESDCDAALTRLDRVLREGCVAERFARMVAALGGPTDFIDHPARYLPQAPVTFDVFAKETGYVTAIDVRVLGMIVVELGGGRHKTGDRIDPAVGLDRLAKIGGSAGPDMPLARVHARTQEAARHAADRVRGAYTVAKAMPDAPPLVAGVIRRGDQ